MNNMRRGFTMIELIFVIVIIGILAAVAIPKLAATRDDAVISGEIASVRQALDNLGAEYTSQATLPTASITSAASATKCFTIAGQGAANPVGSDGNITLKNTVTNSTACPTAIATAVYNMAFKNGIAASAAVDANKTYEFGGSKVVR